MKNGSADADSDTEKRLGSISQRLKILQESGYDVDKVWGILDNIKKARKSAKGSELTKDDIRKALVKVEDYLDVLTEKDGQDPSDVSENDSDEKERGGVADSDNKKKSGEDVNSISEDDLHRRYQKIKTKVEMLERLGGDKSPIKDHLIKLKSAFDDGDRETFQNYEKVTIFSLF